MHGCLHGRSFVHGSLQGSLSHSSWHNFLQRWWMQDHSHGSCKKQYKYGWYIWSYLVSQFNEMQNKICHFQGYNQRSGRTGKYLERICDFRLMTTLKTSWTWTCSKHYSTILTIFIINHGVAMKLYSMRCHHSTWKKIYILYLHTISDIILSYDHQWGNHNFLPIKAKILKVLIHNN